MPRHKLVAAEVRAVLARRGLQQKDLAAVLEISNAAASELCRGIVPFNLDRLDTIAEWLGVPLGDLLGGAHPTASTDQAANSGWRYRSGHSGPRSLARLGLHAAA